MDKEILQQYVNLKFSTRKIAELEQSSQTNVRHWLKKYNLKTQLNQFNESDYFCSCGENNPENFYGHSKQTCSKCHNLKTTETGKNNRLFAVKSLGGKCTSCGYNKYTGALDIHHLDPTIKDKNFKCMRGWGKERILNEIKNCILLCRNCHAEHHAGHLDLDKIN
jgi:hypothetical protein